MLRLAALFSFSLREKAAVRASLRYRA